jgi:hypothetical protein
MTRKLALCAALVLALGACAKRADESPPAASAAPDTPAEESPAGGPPEQGVAPTTAEPAPAPESEPPSSLTGEGKKGADAFPTIEAAEAELARADKALTQLLSRNGKAEKLAVGDDRCGKACKAFSSLERARDAICRIAGEPDARCSRARKIVKDHEPRIAACACEPDTD